MSPILVVRLFSPFASPWGGGVGGSRPPTTTEPAAARVGRGHVTVWMNVAYMPPSLRRHHAAYLLLRRFSPFCYHASLLAVADMPEGRYSNISPTAA